MSAERPPEGAMDELGAAIEVSEARSGLAVLRNAVAMLGSDSAYAGVYACRPTSSAARLWRTLLPTTMADRQRH